MSAELRAGVEKSCAKLKEYWESGEFDKGIAELYAPECVTISAEATITGIPDTIAYFKAVWSKETSKEWKIVQDEVNGEDTFAFARGTFCAPGMDGKFVTIFKKIDGVYKIYNDIYTMDAKKKE